MIIAIDGPAGAGKSTTARALAQSLGYAYVDTGAMYRAVALAARESGLHVGRDDAAIADLARALPLRFGAGGTQIFIGERDVSREIRTPEIGALTSVLAAIPAVRATVVAQQKRLGRESESSCGGAVLEGRDIQTVVFPDAPVKVFLTADASTRASRRLEQWNENAAVAAQREERAAAIRDIEERDLRDSTRAASPLLAAPDAVHLSTDELSPEQIVARIIALVNSAKNSP